MVDYKPYTVHVELIEHNHKCVHVQYAIIYKIIIVTQVYWTAFYT